MKILSSLLGIATVVLLLSTMACGLWIKANHVTDPKHLSFHTTIGIASVIFGIISVILLFIQVFKN